MGIHTFNDQGVKIGYRKDEGIHSQEEIDERRELGPYDFDHPSSMINMVPKWLKDRMMSPVVQKLLALDEPELEAEVKPNITLRRLRSSFWYEYERMHGKFGRVVTNRGREIGIYRMCNGICTPQFFMETVARNDYYIAWLVRPPQNYTKALNESLEHGLSRIREILNFPLYENKYNKEGAPVIDPKTGAQVQVSSEKNANLILKTVAFLDLRVKGSITQKIHQISQHDVRQQSISYHMGSKNNQLPVVDVEALDQKLLSIDDLDKKIASLTQETQKLIENPTWTTYEKKLTTNDEENQLLRHMSQTGRTERDDFEYDPAILKRQNNE